MQARSDGLTWSVVGCAMILVTGTAGCVEDAPPVVEGTTVQLEDDPPPFAPLHVLPETMMTGAPDLVLQDVLTTIDTTALTINGVTNEYFVQQGNYAILFSNNFTVLGPVRVTGASPLIVVACDHAQVDALIDLSAVGTAPGPGAATSGAGIGGAGQTMPVPTSAIRMSSGGGGGGYGYSSNGGKGGTA